MYRRRLILTQAQRQELEMLRDNGLKSRTIAQLNC